MTGEYLHVALRDGARIVAYETILDGWRNVKIWGLYMESICVNVKTVEILKTGDSLVSKRYCMKREMLVELEW